MCEGRTGQGGGGRREWRGRTGLQEAEDGLAPPRLQELSHAAHRTAAAAWHASAAAERRTEGEAARPFAGGAAGAGRDDVAQQATGEAKRHGGALGEAEAVSGHGLAAAREAPRSQRLLHL